LGGRRLSSEERDARRLMRKCRDTLVTQMESYEDLNKFPIEDARRAVAHAYSILARFESELDSIPDDDDFLLELEEIADRTYEGKKEFINLPSKQYDTLIKKIERLKAKIDRVTILNLMVKANRVLAQQMTEREKINELRKRQKYIDIQIHASILAAYNDMIYLALRRTGITDSEITDFSNHLKNLEKDYPLVKMDKDDIIKRLTGGAELIPVEAEYEVVEENPHEKLREVDELL